MATHSSILCWGIPWTEEPGGYSLWSQRAGPTELLAPALSLHKVYTGLPRWLSNKGPACPCWRHTRHVYHPWVRKIHCRRKRHPTPVFLPGKSHGQRSMVGYSPWDCRVEHDVATEHTHTHTHWCVYTPLSIPISSFFPEISFLHASTLTIISHHPLITIQVSCIARGFFTVWATVQCVYKKLWLSEHIQKLAARLDEATTNGRCRGAVLV